MTTFSPTYKPDVGLAIKIKQRILEANFGDGYTQRAKDGINGRAYKVPLTWTNLQLSEANDLIDFFDAQGGFLAFNYTLPNEATPDKFICKEYGKTYEKGNTYVVQALFEKVYDL